MSMDRYVGRVVVIAFVFERILAEQPVIVHAS